MITRPGATVMPLDDFGTYDALGLAALVKAGEVTPLELVDEAIRRIEAVDPQLNAVIHKSYDDARAIAAAGVPDGPFQGVPYLRKELASLWEGVPQTNSCAYFKDFVAPALGSPDTTAQGMNKIRKGDEVIVRTGKDKGRRGTVLQVFDDERVLVEGINIAKKHVKPNPNAGEQGGIRDQAMPLDISNVLVFNPKTKKERMSSS